MFTFEMKCDIMKKKYSGFKFMLDNLYENIGGKIKNWAKWIFIIEAIGAIITGLVLLCTDEDLILYGLLTAICGPFVAWVSIDRKKSKIDFYITFLPNNL